MTNAPLFLLRDNFLLGPKTHSCLYVLRPRAREHPRLLLDTGSCARPAPSAHSAARSRRRSGPARSSAPAARRLSSTPPPSSTAAPDGRRSLMSFRTPSVRLATTRLYSSLGPRCDTLTAYPPSTAYSTKLGLTNKPKKGDGIKTTRLLSIFPS